MKRAILLSLILSVAALGQQTKPILGEQIQWEHSLSRGLVGCWMMNEGSGNLLNDLAGNGRTGTLSATAPTWVGGAFGNALAFGTGKSVSLGTCGTLYSSTGGQSGTTIVRAKINASGATSQILWGMSDVSAGYFTFFLSSQTIRVYGGNGTGDDLLRNTSTTIPLGQWIDIAYSHDGSQVAANCHIYLNGVECSYATTQNADVALPADTAKTLLIGNSVFAERLLDGTISHVLRYNRVLTTSEIVSLYQDPFAMFRPSLDLSLYGALVVPPSTTQVIWVAGAYGAVPFTIVGLSVLLSLLRKQRRK